MRLGGIVTLGFGVGGGFRLLPTIGYVIGAAGVTTTKIHGTDDIEYPDYRKLKRAREERTILAFIREFLRQVE